LCLFCQPAIKSNYLSIISQKHSGVNCQKSAPAVTNQIIDLTTYPQISGKPNWDFLFSPKSPTEAESCLFRLLAD